MGKPLRMTKITIIRVPQYLDAPKHKLFYFTCLQISTIVAQRRPERIHGIVLLAPGFNCLRPGYWYHYSMLPEEVRARVDAGEEQIKIKMRYGGVRT